MRQQTLEDCFYNQDIIKAVSELLESGSYAVSKPVRAGFTTSAIIAAQRAGRLVISNRPACVDSVSRKHIQPDRAHCQINY